MKLIFSDQITQNNTLKTLSIFILLGFFSIQSSFSQDTNFSKLLCCKWGGELDFGSSNKLVLVFKFQLKDSIIKGFMDSPNQGVEDIPADSVTFRANTLYFSVDTYHLSFKGRYSDADTSIFGTFNQGSYNSDMLLKPFKLNRPQEPQKPYPYKEEEVIFYNGDIEFSGTLTIPEGKGPYPAAVLISGSGPQNRNEELFGHKPFMVLADFLTRNGYAVLRYDDRGTGKSKGVYKNSGIDDFASDAYAAFRFLRNSKGVDSQAVGLIGHSEGGMIAPMLASKYPEISFIIMLAGPGIKGDQLLLLQTEMIYKNMNTPVSVINLDKEVKMKIFKNILSETDTAKLKPKIRKIYSKLSDTELSQLGIKREQIDLITEQYLTTEILSLIRFEPCVYLRKVNCPVLALNGDKDLQVPSKQNLPEIKKCLTEGGNKHFETKELWYLNHLFQSASTGAITEYYEIEETISEIALDAIKDWLKNNIKQHN